MTLDFLFNELKEHVYYIVEKDEFWIGPYNVGDFVQEHFKYHYIYVGEL